MAETENITILRVGTEEAVRNIQDLKDNIVQLKKDLQGLDIGSEEYSKTLKELNVNQNALRDAMHYTNTEGQTSEQVMNGIANAASGAGNSYNALVARMSTLRKEWRSTDDIARRNELGKQIKDINKQLKDLDASTGSFKRNVGDYEGALKRTAEGFQVTAGSASAAIGPVKGVANGFKALFKTPLGAVLGLIAAALYKVVNGLKSSEENANRAALAMSGFAGAGDLLKGVMQTLGNAIGWVAEKLNDLLLKVFPKLQEAANLRASIAEKEISLAKEVRKATVENAKDELAASRLRNEAADSENKSIEERRKALKDAIALQERISDREVKIAEKEFEIAKERAKTSQNSKEENDALAQAEAKVYQAKERRYTTTYRLQRQLIALDKEEAAAEQQKLREKQAAEQKAIQTNIDYWKERLKTQKNGSFEEYTTELTILSAETELKKAQARARITDKEELNAVLLQLDKTYLASTLLLADQYASKQIESERQSLENRMNTYAQGSYEYLNAQIELRKFEYDTLAQLDKENDEQFYARKLAADKAYTDAKRALLDKQVQDMQWASNSASSIIGSIADIYESVNAEDEKAAQQTKGLRIAGAIIDTISGAVAAFTSAQSIPPPAGQIIGAANAAAVTAAGIAQIAKIRSTNVSRTSSANTSLSGFSTPTVSTSVPQTTIVRGAQDQALLNQMAQPSRVYILQSDIEAAGKASKARISDTTFE